ncbi:tetratricopeptide repeat protein [Geotalea sp. SG265]|uniref:tetratricopeptide repeat protein n=1 Tax=Geotalea sp. SG265 TaxID=2922867 RepID=UPI001FB02D6A|nr:tetratricopeptide repeat protein [Geotalea sp. SG265]
MDRRRLLDQLKTHWLPLVVLVALGFLVFGGSIGHQFLSNWDDNKYITANETIYGFTWGHLKGVFSTFYVGNYAPVQMVSYMADYELWGLKASGFILTNILLHILNALLLYRILLPLVGGRSGAFFGAVLFLLHPVQVESVDWISQRKNLLSMFFFLLSWTGYVRYREGDGRSAYPLSILAFGMGLLTKSVAVVAPLVFLADDFCRGDRKTISKRLLDKLPYLTAAAIVAVLALISQRPELGGGRSGYHGGSPLATFYTMLPVFARYLQMLVWPVGLSAVYEPPIKSGLDGEVIGAAILLVVLVAACYLCYRRDRILLLGTAVFFIGLLPVSQIVPLITLMNDRYLYFPMAGAGIFFGRLSFLAGEAMGPGRQRIFYGLLCLPLLVLGVAAHERTKVWQDAVTLWSDAAQKTSRSKTAWFGLGNAWDNAGNPGMAESAYRRALTIAPDYREALDNLSFLYLSGDRFTEARDILEVTVQKYPDHRDALLNLGTSHYLMRNFAAAEGAFARALALKPSSAENMMLLANVNLHLGKHAAAVGWYRRAVAMGSPSKDMLYGMGAYAALEGNDAQAFEYLDRAVDAGFGDCVYLRHDPDLERLRYLPAMGPITERVCRDKK